VAAHHRPHDGELLLGGQRLHLVAHGVAVVVEGAQVGVDPGIDDVEGLAHVLIAG